MIRFLPILLIIVLLPVTAVQPSHSLQAQQASHPPGWHPPDGFDHEHGDACPAWVQWLTDPAQSPYAQYWSSDFTWAGNTSPVENLIQDPVTGKFGKHFAFKQMAFRSPAEAFAITHDPQYGFTDQDGGAVSGCIIGHISGTPGDRGAEPHSFRLFLQYADGSITVRGGWVHTADPTHDMNIAETRVPKKCQAAAAHQPCLDEGYTSAQPGVWMTDQRPIWLVIDQQTYDGTYTAGRHESFGQVYFTGIGASWGWGMNESTIFNKGEVASQTDPAGWTPMPNPLAHDQLRLVEVTMQKIPGFPAGGVAWWMCPNGMAVAEQFAPECGPAGAILQWVGSGKGLKGRFQMEWPYDHALTGIRN